MQTIFNCFFAFKLFCQRRNLRTLHEKQTIPSFAKMISVLKVHGNCLGKQLMNKFGLENIFLSQQQSIIFHDGTRRKMENCCVGNSLWTWKCLHTTDFPSIVIKAAQFLTLNNFQSIHYEVFRFLKINY